MALVKNKKGQDMPIATLIRIALGVLVLVIVGMGFYYGWDTVFGKLGLLPGGKLETFTQGCNIAAKASLQTDYCDQFKLINDVPGQPEPVYINCDYSSIKTALTGLGTTLLDCNSAVAAKTFCGGIKDKTKE